MDEVALPHAVEPDQWFVVFHPEAKSRWLSLLACGHFKHVSAFAYCPGFKAWLIYDAQWCGLRLMLFPHGDVAKAAIAAHTKNCVILKMTRANQSMGLSSRLGLYCVSTVKHLLVVRCRAIRPDTLYRHLLKIGAVRVDEGVNSANPGRP
jgi:hypothetical protein